MTTNGKKQQQQKNAKEKAIAVAQAMNEKRQQQALEKIASKSNILDELAIDLINTLKECNSINAQKFTNKLQQYASIICYVRLKRLINSDRTFTEQTLKLKQQVKTLTHESGNKIESMFSEYDSLFYSEYDSDGNKHRKCSDTERKDKIEHELEQLQYLFDAQDLRQDIICFLYKYINKALKDNNNIIANLDNNLLVKPHLINIDRLNYYRDGSAKAKELHQTTYTNAILQCLKVVSRFINDKKRQYDNTIALIDDNKIAYNEYFDEQYNITLTHKASQLTALTLFDADGKQIQQASVKDDINIRNILLKCKLNNTEKYILSKYLDGYTLKHIEHELNITERATMLAWANIRKKVANMYNKKPVSKTNKAKAFNAYSVDVDADGNLINKCFIAKFESLRKAEKVLNCKASLISRVLNKRLQSSKGLYFEYMNK